MLDGIQWISIYRDIQLNDLLVRCLLPQTDELVCLGERALTENRCIDVSLSLSFKSFLDFREKGKKSVTDCQVH